MKISGLCAKTVNTIFPIGFAVLIGVCLTGCGFQPLYGPHSQNTAGSYTGGSYQVQDELNAVRIAKLPKREGQILRNYLLDKLTPSGEPLQAQLYLDMDLKLEKEITSLRRDGTSQRYNTTATVDIKLYEISAHEDRLIVDSAQFNKPNYAASSPRPALSKQNLLFEDQIIRTTSYSIGRSAMEPGYPGTVADKDSRKRVLKLVADDIQLMVASYLVDLRSQPKQVQKKPKPKSKPKSNHEQQ